MYGIRTRKQWRGEVLEPVTMTGHRGDAAILGAVSIGNFVTSVVAARSGDIGAAVTFAGLGIITGLTSAGEIMLDRLPDAPVTTRTNSFPSSPPKLYLVPPIDS